MIWLRMKFVFSGNKPVKIDFFVATVQECVSCECRVYQYVMTLMILPMNSEVY